MRHLERHRGQRPYWLVAKLLVSADPELPLMLALHVAAPRMDRVAFDRLPNKGFAFGGPVFQRAGLEIEIERLAIGADGADAFVRLWISGEKEGGESGRKKRGKHAGHEGLRKE